MTRAVLVLNNAHQRSRASAWCRSAPQGTRVEFKEVKRTLPQNDRMWAMLTDVSKQAHHAGRQYTPDEWKVIFLHALGRQVEFLPALDGHSFVPYGQHSSDLGKSEMSELIELIKSWGAQNGVEFYDHETEQGEAHVASNAKQNNATDLGKGAGRVPVPADTEAA